MISLALCATAIFIAQPAAPTSRLATQPNQIQRARDGPSTALARAADIELFAACLSAGVTPATAAATVAQMTTAAEDSWSSAAAMLTIGSPAKTAWQPLEGIPDLEEVARIARISEHTGSALSASCERIAADIRARSNDDATAAAERAGVLIAIPLVACFLPAFIVLGLAPIIANLAITMINTHP